MITYSEDIDNYKDSNNILNEISLSSMKCTESRRCACYKGKCWACIDDKKMPKTGW